MFRDWACASLENAGRPYRIAFQSASTAGILAAVKAGLAVSVFAASIVPEGMRVLSEADGFPTLPETSIYMRRAPGKGSPVVEAIASYLREGFKR